MKMTSQITLVVLLTLLFSCAGEEEKQDTYSKASPEVKMIDAGMNAIGGTLDEFDGASDFTGDELTASCNAAGAEPCGVIRSAARERTYACSRADGFRIDGTVTLSYSDSLCRLRDAGQNVTRTVSATLRQGETNITLSSAMHTDYAGQFYNGGAQVMAQSRTSRILSISGMRRLATENGALVGDLSVKSASPTNVGQLPRAARRVSSGSLSVSDNQNRSTALIQMSNLSWRNGCCFPVSGSLSLSLSGSTQGSRSVVFKDCGVYDLRNNDTGETTEQVFLSCGG